MNSLNNYISNIWDNVQIAGVNVHLDWVDSSDFCSVVWFVLCSFKKKYTNSATTWKGPEVFNGFLELSK